MCFVFNDPYEAKSLVGLLIKGKGFLNKEAISEIKGINYKHGSLEITTKTNRFVNIDSNEDKFLVMIKKYLADPADIIIIYNTEEKERAFKFNNCKFKGFSDIEETHYIYNERTIVIEFEPVDFKTEVKDDRPEWAKNDEWTI